MWAIAAILGINLVFVKFVWLYAGMKLLGGFYFLYLGVKMVLGTSRSTGLTSLPGTLESPRGAFSIGLLANLTNPSVVVFYGSIFTSLLTPSLPHWVKMAAGAVIIMRGCGIRSDHSSSRPPLRNESTNGHMAGSTGSLAQLLQCSVSAWP